MPRAVFISHGHDLAVNRAVFSGRLSAVRKPPQRAFSVEAKISIPLPPAGPLGCCTFEVFDGFCRGAVEDGRGLRCICESSSPRRAFRKVWKFFKRSGLASATVLVWFSEPVSARTKSAAERADIWFVRQLRKLAREAA